jgi:peptidoglycan/LPS O-acetylase OafA/YrhL
VNTDGILIGLATFLTIGIFHPLVIKAEYYFGRRCWWAFLLGGILAAAGSLLCSNQFASIILGVVAFSAFWGIGEVFAQHRRVKKGWFPMNPKRKKDYE